MTSELLFSVLRFNLVIAAASIVMIALRGTLLSQFGARIAYRAWLVVPLAGLATLAPPREIATAEVAGASQISPLIGAAMLEPSGLVDQAWLPAALTIIWLLGASAAFSALFWRHRRFVRALGGLTADVICGAPVQRASTNEYEPLTLGALRPAIVVPADFEERFTPRAQALIIAHERCHIRSGDVVVNAVLEFAVCAFWFNPILKGAIRCMREDQEMACDAAVLAQMPAVRRTYAEALLNTQAVVEEIPAGCGWPSTDRTLARRIAALGNKPPSRNMEALGLLVVFGLGCSMSLAVWATEVRRTAPAPQVARYVDRTEPQGADPLERGTAALQIARPDLQRGLRASRSSLLPKANDEPPHAYVVRNDSDHERASDFAEDFNSAGNRSSDERHDLARNTDQRSDEANR